MKSRVLNLGRPMRNRLVIQAVTGRAPLVAGVAADGLRPQPAGSQRETSVPPAVNRR